MQEKKIGRKVLIEKESTGQMKKSERTAVAKKSIYSHLPAKRLSSFLMVLSIHSIFFALCLTFRSRQPFSVYRSCLALTNQENKFRRLFIIIWCVRRVQRKVSLKQRLVDVSFTLKETKLMKPRSAGRRWCNSQHILNFARFSFTRNQVNSSREVNWRRRTARNNWVA